MVGRALVAELVRRGHPVFALSRRPAQVTPGVEWAAWDIARDPAPGALTAWRATHIVHAAAFTDVDAAEASPDAARSVNVDGCRRVAEFAQKSRARLVYLSTDSVFDGATGGYAESDTPHPLNVYAETKAEGERIAASVPGALTVRFNVVGPSRLAWWILDSAASGKPVDVFSDVVFNPLEVSTLTAALVALADSDLSGVCHLAADEALSKAEFARRLADAAKFGARARFTSVRLADRQPRAARPLNTSLVPSPRALAVTGPPPSLDSTIRHLAATYVASAAKTSAPGD